MMIQPLSDVSILSSGAANSSYDAARTNAEAHSFQAMLGELKRKAEASKETESHVKAAQPLSYEPKHPMTAADKESKKLREACEGFEAMFLSMMYKQMRATVPKDGLFGHSNAIDIFEDLRDTELMNAAAKSGGIGLADMMFKQLSPTVLKK